MRSTLQDRLGTWPLHGLSAGALWAQMHTQLAMVERMSRLAGGTIREEFAEDGEGGPERVVRIALAGFAPEDVHVEIVEYTLEVRAESGGRSVNWSSTLPRDVDRERVHVEMAEGLLAVHLPRAEAYRRELSPVGAGREGHHDKDASGETGSGEDEN